MLRKMAATRLFDRIGEIGDNFLEEVYLIDIAGAKAKRHKRIVGGTTAGVAVVTGAVVVYWRWKKNRLARIA